MTLPRVLSYPPRHPFVDRFDGTVARLVKRDEPMPRLDRFYDPVWVAAEARRWDIAHLHFGHEQHPVDRVLEAVAAHRASGVPVAFTVHDLQIPHLPPDSGAAEDLVIAVAPSVDALVTPSRGCADAVRRLTGRAATVIPHGPLVGAGRRHRLRTHRRLAGEGHGHLLVHVGRWRPNLGLEELAAACRLVQPSLPVRLQVHCSAVDRVTSLVGDVRGIDVVGHDHLSDAEFERNVADATAVLLPYRWGTHSGLLELAADIGTPVLRTAVGHLCEQPHTTPPGHPEQGIAVHDHRIDVDELAATLQRPIGPAPMLPALDRARSEEAALRGHERLYHRLRTCTPMFRSAA